MLQGAQKLLPTSGGVSKGHPPLSQSIDLYKQQQLLMQQNHAGVSNLIYNNNGGRFTELGGYNTGANSALGHPQNALLLSETNSAYLR